MPNRLLLNSFNYFRNKIPSRFWHIKHEADYKIDLALGVCRGIRSLLIGRLKFEKSFRNLVIGPKCHFQMEKGSSVTLTKRNQPPTNGSSLETGISEISALGFRVNWRFMNPPTDKKTIVRLQENSILKLGPNVSIMPGAYLSVWPNQELEFAEDVATGVEIYISTACGLTIGKGSMLGHQVKIMDYDGHPLYREVDGQEINDGGYGGPKKKIKIGDYCWIGFRSTILKGVTIGDGSIIAANSVVTKDIPPNCVAAGNPAKVVAEGIIWKRY